MEQDLTVTDHRLTTPRAAAVAGILFSVLFIISLVLIRIAVPVVSDSAGASPVTERKSIEFVLHLLPFTGIAFLWFIGVLRDRLGVYEDRFFATVFFGSGLLFLAMLFAAAAVANAVMLGQGALADGPAPGIYTFGRTVVYQLIHVYAMKMSGVFMISTCTVAIRTRIFPRWMAYLGFVLALLLLLSTGMLYWTPLVFPLWVLLISVHILLANLKPDSVAAP